MNITLLRAKARALQELAAEILELTEASEQTSKVSEESEHIEEIKHYIQVANSQDPLSYTPINLDWAIKNKIFRKVGNFIYFSWKNVGIQTSEEALRMIGTTEEQLQNNRPRVSLPYKPELLARLRGVAPRPADTGVRSTVKTYKTNRQPKTEWSTYE